MAKVAFWIVLAACAVAAAAFTPWQEVGQVLCEQAAATYGGKGENSQAAPAPPSAGPSAECDGFQMTRGVLSFFDSHGEAITALFTVVLALSTIALWNATRRLWLAGERQTDLTRESIQVAAASAEAARSGVEHARQTANRARDVAINAARMRIRDLDLELSVLADAIKKAVDVPNRRSDILGSHLTNEEANTIAARLGRISAVAAQPPVFATFLEDSADMNHALRVQSTFAFCLSAFERPANDAPIDRLRIIAARYAKQDTLDTLQRFNHQLTKADQYFDSRLTHTRS
jgi:hypothetical protein